MPLCRFDGPAPAGMPPMIACRAPEIKAVALTPSRPPRTLPEPWGAVFTAAAHWRCSVVRQVTAEMVMLVSERAMLRRDRHRVICHVRQISMYICSVVLQIPLADIGHAFGRDRTTVGHACQIIEDRRDNRAYDEFVASIERVVLCVFGAAGGRGHE